jgi:hypothetical protein
MKYRIEQDDKELDELFATNVESVHLERLDDNMIWLRISGDNKDIIVTLTAYKNKLQTEVNLHKDE